MHDGCTTVWLLLLLLHSSPSVHCARAIECGRREQYADARFCLATSRRQERTGDESGDAIRIASDTRYAALRVNDTFDHNVSSSRGERDAFFLFFLCTVGNRTILE